MGARRPRASARIVWILLMSFVLCKLGLTSHPVKAPYMALLVMHYERSQNSHWGWPSRKVCVPALARRGFKSGRNDFLFSRSLRSQRLLRRFFMIATETTLIVIDCIGDYYFNIDNIESYPTYIYIYISYYGP